MVGLTTCSVACFGQSAYSDAAQAQPESPAPVDVSVQLAELVAKHDVPALAAVLIEGGVIRVEGVAGVRARGNDARATLDDQWHLGSCTKAMTATLAALMVDRQQLTWDTPLFEVFPKLAENADAGWGKATLGMFVTNTSGTPTGLDRDGLWGRLWNTNETPAEARRMLIAGVTKHPPIAESGTKYEYANGGFAIAGAMMERTAGVPYEELLRRELLEPLGIRSAGFGAPGVPGVTAQPMGHTKDGQAVPPTRGGDNPMAIAPAGCVHMSIRDWAKFAMLHARGDARNPNRRADVLTPQAFDWLHTPRLNNYAGGWVVTKRPWADGPDEDKEGFVLTHAGSNTMWFAVVWIAPERDMAMLACTNIAGENGPKAADEAIQVVMKKWGSGGEMK